MDYDNKEANLPSQGGRIPSGRRGGDMVPAPPSSLSSDGRNGMLPTGMPSIAATVEGVSNLENDIITHGGAGISSIRKEEERDILQYDFLKENGNEVPAEPLRVTLGAKKRIFETSVSSEGVDNLSFGTPLHMDTPIVISDESGLDEAGKRTDKKRQKKKSRRITRASTSANRIDIEDSPERRDELTYLDMTPGDLGAIALERINSIDNIRVKSGNLQGKLSGKMKRDVEELKSIVRALALRAEASGDPAALRKENLDLKVQIKESKFREQKLVKELDEAINKSGDLMIRVSESEKKISDIQEETAQIFAIQEKITANRKKISSLIVESNNTKDTNNTKETNNTNDVSSNQLANLNSLQADDFLNLDPKEKDLFIYRKLDELSNIVKGGAFANVITKNSNNNNKNINRKLIDNKTKDDSSYDSSRYESSDITKRFKNRVSAKILSNIKLDKKFIVRDKSDTGTGTDIDSGTTWSRVSRKSRSTKPEEVIGVPADSGKTLTYANVRPEVPTLTKRRVRKTAVVSIFSKDHSYAKILDLARKGISLETIGIEGTRLRRAANGGMLIELKGPDCKLHAKCLADKLVEILPSAVNVKVPSPRGELRLTGFDESINADEIRGIISELGECVMEDVKIGKIVSLRNGLCAIWAQCPLESAVKIANQSRVRVGWSLARVELLKTRPIQCFKCWEYGHARGDCPSELDRSGNCFQCGDRGHTIKNCVNEAICVICRDRGFSHRHKLGSFNCTMLTRPTQGKAKINVRTTTATDATDVGTSNSSNNINNSSNNNSNNNNNYGGNSKSGSNKNNSNNNNNYNSSINVNSNSNSKPNPNAIPNGDKNGTNNDNTTGYNNNVEATSNKILSVWRTGNHGDEATTGASERCENMEVEDGF